MVEQAYDETYDAEHSKNFEISLYFLISLLSSYWSHSKCTQILFLLEDASVDTGHLLIPLVTFTKLSGQAGSVAN
jgi:hypothetical protein